MITVIGSHGTFTADLKTGEVREHFPHFGEAMDDAEVHGYPDIVRVDVDEYRRAYPDEEVDTVDILDIGYWLTDGRYEPPEPDYRRTVMEALLDNRREVQEDPQTVEEME